MEILIAILVIGGIVARIVSSMAKAGQSTAPRPGAPAPKPEQPAPHSAPQRTLSTQQHMPVGDGLGQADQREAMDHRMQTMRSRLDEGHLHPAQADAQRVEAWSSQGSLGDYAGEGCDTPLSVRPIAMAGPARRRAVGLPGSALVPRTRADFVRGVIFAEAVMKRGGRQAR